MRRNFKSTKNILCFVLITLMTLGLFSITVYAEQTTATPTPQTVLVNGRVVEFESYLIKGRNYFKLRDLAYAMNGTAAQFNVEWDAVANTVRIYSNTPYAAVGGEMSAPATSARTATLSKTNFLLDGESVSGSASSGDMRGFYDDGRGHDDTQSDNVYNIGGSNYFMLRHIGDLTGYLVGWDSTKKTIAINTQEMRTRVSEGNITERFLRSFLETGTVRMYSMALDRNGNLWGWWDSEGFGDWGVTMNDQTTRKHTEPELIMKNVIDFASSNMGYALAVTADGILWGWGYNEFGQLGDGTTENRFSPVQIMDNVVSVEVSDISSYAERVVRSQNLSFISYAVKSDGSLWGWGRGNIGVKVVAPGQIMPIKIMDNVTSVSANIGSTMVITSDETLWGWGDNSAGQLGDGTTEFRHAPVKVMDNVTSVTAKSRHTMVIRTDGSLWGWGDNSLGQLGVGTVGNYNYNDKRLNPVRIMDNIGHVSTGLGRSPTMAVGNDGGLWALTGQNSGPDGTAVSPVKVLGNVSFVSIAGRTSMAVTTDGNLWVLKVDFSYNSSYGNIENRTTLSKKIMGNIVKVAPGGQQLTRVPDNR